jgi:hypothetical protein
VIENGSRRIPRDFNLHWGKGQIVEEASIQGEHHQPSVQLLEFQDGSLSIRFCYYNQHGRFQRSPLIMGEEEICLLGHAVSENRRLHALLSALIIPS